MIALRPANGSEFDLFRSYCLNDQGADGDIRRTIDDHLPSGIATPDQILLSIVSFEQSSVGLIWYTLTTRNGQREAFIIDFVVYPEHQRRGYGKAALESLEDLLAQSGVTKVALSVSSENHRAASLYVGSGFTSVYTRMTKPIKQHNKSS